MNKKSVQELLTRILDELKNLEHKIEEKEPAGWEGYKRRSLLKLDIKDALQMLSYDIT